MSQSSSDDQGNYSTRRFGPVLCRCCDKFFSDAENSLLKGTTINFFETVGESRYHSTLQDLRDAIKFGCQLCILIEYDIRHCYRRLHEAICANDDSTPLWNCELFLSMFKSFDDTRRYRLTTSPGPVGFGNSNPHICMRIKGGLVSEFAYPGASERENIKRELNFMKKHHGPNYTPPDTTDSPAAWELCRAWINKCIETHDKCKSFQTESPDPSKLPTRLLYIASLGYNNLSEDHLNSLNIQIHITKEKGIKGSYMTLSHCWGDAGGILKLTNKNYKQWIETGFPYKDLPKTFQDAVRLSLFLRNDYLWVDSLCIIQSPDPSDLDTKSDAEVANGDWIRESKTMTDVYRYSKCNIAATASRGPTEGCFYSRKHPITKVSPLEIRLGQERYLFMSDSLIETNVDDAPLDKRAWVLQERILAPRQINCCRFQLSWECQESLACETFPFIYEPHVEFDVQSNVGPLKMHSMPLTLLEVEYLRFSKEKLDMFPGCRNCDYNIHQYQNTESFSKEISQVQKTLAQLKGATRNEWIAHAIFHLYNEWTFIVEGYSKRTLSYRNDKLVAIDGIASRMRDVLQGLDEYVAGLWRSQLHWQLLWQTELFKDSDNMPINTNDMSSRYDIGPSWSWANIDTGVGWDNRIPFDEASKSIFTIDILEVYDRHTVTKNDTISSAKESPLTVRCLLCKFSKRETLAKIGGFDVGMWMDTKMDDAEKHKLLGQSFIMVVSYKINGDDNPTISVNGLIVSPCEGRPGFYMRIGYCVFFLVHDLFQDFKGAVKEDREDITLI